jgi:acyl-CoA thioester hydrolase
MGVMNNARYLEYFEAGRNQLLRELGYPYNELEKMNYGLPVIEAYAKYIAVARYDDLVIIKATLKEKPGVRIKIYYDLFVGSKHIASGYTVHSFIRLDTLKPVRPPADFVKLVESKLNQP